MPRSCARGGRSNFRYGLYPSYKSNRREKIKPWGYQELVDWALDTYPVIQIDNVETGDILGSSYLEGDVIVSGDKDMKTIPGAHFQGELVFEVSEDEADHNFFMQALHGDSTDGYPGCPGVGPVMANKLLAAKATANAGRWCSPPIARKALMSSMPLPKRGWLASSGPVNTTTMRVNQSFGFPLFNCLLITRP